MRPLTTSERRLLWVLLGAGFVILNFWGYNELALRRTRALGQQRMLRTDIVRLEQLRLEKPNAELNREWLASRLPAYKDVDQLETYLYRTVSARAQDLGIELTKQDPRPTQKDELVHRSIVDIEFTDEIEAVTKFLHAIQDQEAFRFISHLELAAGKDPKNIRCQARIEQWWHPESESLAADLPTMPAVAPSTAPAISGVESGSPADSTMLPNDGRRSEARGSSLEIASAPGAAGPAANSEKRITLTPVERSSGAPVKTEARPPVPAAPAISIAPPTQP
ncbi:MAG: hypothetical protein ACR2OZ_04285 [Verrucomicrobiales bacterium]